MLVSHVVYSLARSFITLASLHRHSNILSMVGVHQLRFSSWVRFQPSQNTGCIFVSNTSILLVTMLLSCSSSVSLPSPLGAAPGSYRQSQVCWVQQGITYMKRSQISQETQIRNSFHSRLTVQQHFQRKPEDLSGRLAKALGSPMKGLLFVHCNQNPDKLLKMESDTPA